MASDLAKICERFLGEVNKVHPDIDRSFLQKKLEEYGRQFRDLDEDESGDLSLDEIKKAVKMSDEDLKTLVSRVDDDNTGTLRLREFLNLRLLLDKIIENPVPESAVFQPKVVGRRHGAVKKKKRGFLMLKAAVKKAGSGFELNVMVVKAKELLPMDYNGKSDPFVKLYVQPDPKKKSKKKTAVKKKTLEPQWDETFSWTFPASTKLEDLRLELTVYDWDRITANDFMGRMSFPLNALQSQPVDGWYILLDETQGQLYNFPARDSGIDGSLRAPPMHDLKVTTMAPLPLPAAAKKLKETDFEYLKVLGRGNFGKVLLARHRPSSMLVAIKALKKPRIIEEGDLPATATERSLLIKAAECPFLSHLVGAFQTPGNVFFVMDFYSGGDLMFQTLKQGRLSEYATSFYVAEISLGLFFLHQHKIFYRDLKLDNVMLDGAGHVHIADFGLAKDMTGHPTGKTNTFCGTPNYLAPEIVRNQFYGDEVDWWSLGVMTYEMLTGEALFDGMDPDPDRAEQKLYEQILSKPLNFPRTLSERSRSLLAGFLDRAPARRLGFGGEAGEKAIRAQAFFGEHNWAALEARTAQAPLVPSAGAPDAAANFDLEYTSAVPTITPEHPAAIAGVPQDLFQNFSFVSSRL